MTTYRNYTDIADELVRAIYAAVCPAGLPAHDVAIKNLDRAGRGARGSAYRHGSGYHASARPFVVVSIAQTDARSRCVMGTGGGGYLPIAIGSRIEALVLVLAHELRHLWQGSGPRARAGKPRVGMVYGSRGRISERDADAYALQMLRRYRRGELL